jgi:hypothetical protein
VHSAVALETKAITNVPAVITAVVLPAKAVNSAVMQEMKAMTSVKAVHTAVTAKLVTAACHAAKAMIAKAVDSAVPDSKKAVTVRYVRYQKTKFLR